jgi:small neutral amino acid transporter SnatA (MarC family)
MKISAKEAKIVGFVLLCLACFFGAYIWGSGSIDPIRIFVGIVILLSALFFFRLAKKKKNEENQSLK